MEKNVIVILTFLLIVALLIAIVYKGIFIFLKPPATQRSNDNQRYLKDTQDKYRRIIEQSKEDYKALMNKKNIGP